MRIFLLATMVVGLAMPTLAEEAIPADDTPQRRVAAQKLLELFNMNDTYDQAMKQAMSMAVGMIDSQDIPEDEKANARKAVETSMGISMQKFSWERMRGMFIDVYSDILSLEELEGLIAFYQSPIGQKFLRKQPQLSLATMEKMQLLMMEMMPDLQKAVDEALALEAVIEWGGE
jgi:hypothetical protein